MNSCSAFLCERCDPRVAIGPSGKQLPATPSSHGRAVVSFVHRRKAHTRGQETTQQPKDTQSGTHNVRMEERALDAEERARKRRPLGVRLGGLALERQELVPPEPVREGAGLHVRAGRWRRSMVDVDAGAYERRRREESRNVRSKMCACGTQGVKTGRESASGSNWSARSGAGASRKAFLGRTNYREYGGSVKGD